MCLLLAAATVWAQVSPRLNPEIAPKKPAMPGSPGESSESILKRLSGSPESLSNRPESILKRLSPSLESLSNRPESILKRSATSGEPPDLTFKTREQTEAVKQRAELEQRLKQVAGPQLKLIQEIAPGFSPPAIVEGSVRQFATGFEAGARNPDRFLSEVPPDLLSKWTKVPRDKRIFVIGAGKDSARISEWTKLLRSDGYEVFFYEFCSEGGGALCSHETVGAMCAKSGLTVLYETPSAKLSKYVQVEIATAGFVEGLNDRVFLISNEELVAGHLAMYVVNMPTPTPSAVK
jgi:hypothetical protein